MRPIALVPAGNWSPSVIPSISAAISWELYDAKHQWINAIAAVLLGTAMLWKGELAFRWLLVWMSAIFVSMLVINEVAIAWDLELHNSLRYGVGAQVAMLVAYIAWRGFEGVAALFGVAAGAVIATRMRPLLVSFGLQALETDPWAVVVLYTLSILLFVVLLDERVRPMLMPLVSPAVGGALVSSSVSFGITELAATGSMTWVFGDLRPAAAPWVEFLTFLCDEHSKDVGLFAGAQHNFALWGQEYSLDRVLGCFFWLLLFIVGAIVQCRARQHRSLRKDGDGDSSRPSSRSERDR